MAHMMDINVLGVVENMSYLKCPDCGKKINVFGQSKIEEFANELDFKVLAKLPLNPDNTALMDKGLIEQVSLPEINSAVEAIVERSK